MLKGDGDGWVVLPDGSRRWGLHGASGLLLHTLDSAGTGQVLLQHRAAWTHQGDTWGLPGGARNSGESSVEAALREFGEEVAGELGVLSLAGIHRQDHQVWSFDTVLASTPEQGVFSPGNSESKSIRWVPVDEVPSMELIPAFGRVWPQVETALSERLLLIVDAASVDGRADAGRLRDDLAGLARAGMPGASLPPGVPLTPLHHRFPSVVLVVEESARSLSPAPGVEVLPAAGGSAEAITELVRLRSDRACAVVATADRALRSRCAAAGGHPVSPAWLLGAVGMTEAADLVG
ncbi:NUDIX hydrolase [Actinorugispora endophytica]|uniref:ADP-ribose pyrophosphatase YjhB (NUDIX family) n=1 Tax=Actinorugispora endophytica TaxID=1605990 RepID=A0A4R6V8G9_9ACTN|nr:NUDIX domain-containing protein [Actinorugispora endophytica]TDQ55439.1 ADP-ribose pyrophosphatase YjhB (NUDIX family) [Actinorugispora endophytica]